MSGGLRLLGPMELVAGHDPATPGGAKERCLLAVLAVRAGQAVSEDELVDALWGDTPPRTAAKTLQNYVLRLRRALRACPGLAIHTRPPGYCLEIGPDTLDVAAADRLVAAGRCAAAAGEHGHAVEQFRAALRLWRGPALAEFADRPFARAEVARLAELREASAEDLAESELALGRHHETVPQLETMVTDRPLRERRWGQLMLALYRDGRQADALAAFRRLRAALAEQLGVDPAVELQDLHAAILRHDMGLQLSLSGRGNGAGPIGAGGSPARATPPHVGRDAELGRLLERLAEAETSRGGVALVVGEPGIGKTRLLSELAVAAGRRGATVLSGRCIEGSGVRPFHPFTEALDGYLTAPGHDGPSVALLPVQLTPRWSGGDPGDSSLQPDELRLRLLDGTARFIADLTRSATVVIGVDDLHWADASTVAMLRHLARTTRNHRLLLLGTYRAGELAEGHPLHDALAELHSEAECTTVALTGLGRVAVDRLLGSTAGGPLATELVDAIATETGGNPFFAREMVRHLLDEGALRPGPGGVLHADLPLSAVPEGVRQVIARRRRRLSPAANQLLDTAAVVEGPFPFSPVSRVAGLDGEQALRALDEALTAGLVVPETTPERYSFAHALIRHASYVALNPSRRTRLHRQLAEELAGAQPAVAAAEVAAQYHRSAALPGADAGVGPAMAAAAHARAAGAHDEDAAFLRIAIGLARPGDPRLPRLSARLATALSWSLRFDEAVRTAHGAAEAIAEAEGPGQAAAFIADVATALTNAGSNAHAWQLSPLGLSRVGLTWAGIGRDGPGLGGLGQRGAACGEPVEPDPDPVTWASLTLLELDRCEATDPDNPGIPLDLPGRRTALRILHQSGRLAGRADLDRYAVAAIYGSRDRIPASAAENPTVALFLLGDAAAALPRFQEQAAAARDRGLLAWELYCRACVARCHTTLGDLTAAAVTQREVDAIAARAGGARIGWQLIHHLGSRDALSMALDERTPGSPAGPRLDPPEHRWAGAAMDAAAARGLARAGRTEEALALLSRPIRALRHAPSWAPNYARLGCDTAETLWLLDRRDHLVVVETALREKTLEVDFRPPMMDSRLALARLCALDGRTDEARRWFDAARVVLDEQSALPLRAVVDHDEALMHTRAGDAAAARPYAASAAARFRALGMTGWARRLSSIAR